MSDSQVLLEISPPVARMTFVNPDDGLMDEPMEQRFAEAVETVLARQDVRVCLLAGDGTGSFVRHYDLKVLARRGAAMAERGLVFGAERPVPEAPIHTAMRRMEGSDVIFVAALNGTAMGGGFEIALACDFRLVAAGPYQFGLPEINLGLLPGAGGTQRLPRIVGLARALEITLLGQCLSPDDLARLGLVTGAPCADVLAEGDALSRRISALPARAAAHIKHLVRGAAGPGATDPGFGIERALFCDLMVDPDSLRLVTEGARGQRRITDAP